MTRRYLIVCQDEHGNHDHLDTDTLKEAASMAGGCFHLGCGCRPVVYERVSLSMVEHHRPQVVRPDPRLP